MSTKFKCTCKICNQDFDVEKYITKLPCGHDLSEREFYGEFFFQVIGLERDGLSPKQAFDAMCRAVDHRYRNMFSL